MVQGSYQPPCTLKLKNMKAINITMPTIVSRCKLQVVRTQHHKLEKLKSPRVMVDSRVFLKNAGEVLNLFNLMTRVKVLASIV